MSAMSPLPKDHPIMIAWEKYKYSDAYDNSFRWAEHEQHREGSMWAAFLAGYDASYSRALDLTSEGEAAECVACEGNPKAPNIPCAICGRYPAPQPAQPDLEVVAHEVAIKVATSGKTGRVHQMAYIPAKEAALMVITDAQAHIAALTAKVERLLTLNADLAMQAKGHAQEARTANGTIYEIYQALSGAKGESGNWNGAQPVIEYIETAEARVAQLYGLLDVALESLDNYADPSGYFDNLGKDSYTDGDQHHPGVLAKETATSIRAALGGQSNE